MLRSVKKIDMNGQKACVKRQKNFGVGQSTIEFILGMTIVVLMIYAAVKVFAWAGISLAERRMVHDNLLVSNAVVEGWNYPLEGQGPLTQIDPNFYKSRRMCAIPGDCP